MKILLTEHAKEGLKEREIDFKEVETVINCPERTFYDLRSGHFVVVSKRKIPGHWLIVVYNKREDEIEVITIIDTSKSIEKIIERRLSSKRWIEV